MKHIGLDTHSTTTMATVLNDRGRKILRREIPTKKHDLIELMESIPGEKRVALEENQLADFIARVITPYVMEVIRCQPQHNRLISESENKCDAKDSESIAELLFLNKLKPVHHPSWQHQQLRQGIRTYWIVSRDLSREKSRLKAVFLYSGIHCEGEKVFSKRYRASYTEEFGRHSGNLRLLELSFKHLDCSRERKAAYLRMLRALAEPFQGDVQRLMGIPGIGPIGAYTLVAFLEDGWRLPNKRKLWQYGGIGIRNRESNNKGHKGAARTGNRYLKNVLFTAVASVAARRVENNALTKRWNAARAAGADIDHLRRSLARKIAVVAQYLLRHKEQYQDERITATQ